MEIPTGSTLYFDTNIFLSANDDKCSELQELAATKNVKCCCPPRVLIELLSHINSDEKDKFKRYQAAFRKQKEICSFCILPYPQHILADYFGLNRQDFKLSPFGDFIQTRGHILNSKGYDEFLEKMPPAQDAQDASGKLIPFENLWHNFRERYENIWVALANEEILKTKKAFLNEMIQVAGGECANELSPSRVDELLKPIEAHFSTLTKVLEENKKQKYSQEKLKNYYNDLELLLYLGRKDHFFITNDKKLREKVDDSCWQKKRILTFDEAIEKLQS